MFSVISHILATNPIHKIVPNDLVTRVMSKSDTTADISSFLMTQECRSNFSMLSAVIFDLDGVLADSEPWWNEIDAKLLAEYGVTYRGEYHQNVVWVSYRLAVEFYKKAFGFSVSTEEMMGRLVEIATEFFSNWVDLFPKAKAVLEELGQMILHVSLATS